MPIADIFNRAAIIPSIEAVEEVKVQVSVYDAEMGRTGGGVFNATHKSGSNACARERARYNAVVLNGERRQHNGWGMRVNYTFSARQDNRFGEGNFFAPNPSAALDNYDLDREFGYSLLDTPHRTNISGTIELPFGEGKRWLSGQEPVDAHPGRLGIQRRDVPERASPGRCN